MTMWRICDNGTRIIKIFARAHSKYSLSSLVFTFTLLFVVFILSIVVYDVVNYVAHLYFLCNMCVKLANKNLGDRGYVFVTHHIIIIKSKVPTFSIGVGVFFHTKMINRCCMKASYYFPYFALLRSANSLITLVPYYADGSELRAFVWCAY